MLTSEEFVKLTKLKWLALCTALITAALVSAEMADAGRKIHSDAAAIVTKSLDSLQQHAEDKSPASGEEIDWKCLSSGGTQSSDGSFVINGTLGQLAVGTSSDGTSDTRHGYWQNFAYKWECGDVNMSGDIDIDDIIYLIAYVFLGGPPPVPLEIGDTNCIDNIDIDDVMFLVNYVFLGGPLPCDPNGDDVPDCP
ncbi:MAG: hypothetical protein ABIK83_13190 [Candidatus Zixiibacteriota bacterium]